MKIIKMPTPMRMVWGSGVAYLLAGVIHPSFVAIAVMIALFIPILIAEHSFPDTSHLEPDINHEPDTHHHLDMSHHPHQPDYNDQKLIAPNNQKLMGKDN